MKKYIVLVVCLFLAFTLSAYPSLSELLPDIDDETYSSILAGEIVTQSTTDGDLSMIAPKSKYVSEKIAAVEAMEKGFGVAVGSLVPYPKGWKTMSGEERTLALYNTLLKVSTMTGLTYISHRAGDKEKTLFDECSMLSSDNKKDKIDDPVVTAVPSYAEYYSYQDDTSFGGNVYSMTYSVTGSEIFMDIRNNNDLKFMGISLVKKDKVNMSLDIEETEEGIYVYALASVRDKNSKVNVIFYTVDLELSFYNRIVALSKWFKNTLNGV